MENIFRLVRLLAISGAVAVAAGTTAAAAERCAPLVNAPAAVTQAVRDFFAALTKDDAKAYAAITTSDFFAYDGGVDMPGDTLLKIVVDGHAKGSTYVWTVNEARVEAVCDLATIAYINRGSVKDAAGDHPVVWLESAVLRYDEGRWRVAFLHSTRAKAK